MLGMFADTNDVPMWLKELLAFDTARSAKAKEEIYGFNIGLSLETSINGSKSCNSPPAIRAIYRGTCP